MSLSAVCLLALWCGFTGSLSWQELTLGVVTTGLTTVFLGAVLHTSKLRARIMWTDALLLCRLPWDVALDCAVLLRVFVRSFRRDGVPSLLRACGFKASRRDPLRVGRAAFATAYLSASPNTIVIGVDPEQSLMLYHQLEAREMATAGRKLGAQA